MRSRGRKDSNQDEIVQALRDAGCTVYVTSGVGKDFPDLVVGTTGTPPEWVTKPGTTILMEIKTEDGKLSDGQRLFLEKFKGAAVVVRSVDEALIAVGKE